VQQWSDNMQSDRNSSVSEKDKAMSDVASAQALLHGAFPELKSGGEGRVKAAIYEAYRFLKPKVEPRISRPFTERRVRSIHEGKARLILGAELDALKEAELKEARREQQNLRARLAALDARLTVVDEDFYGETLAAIREQAAGLGRVSGTGDRQL
jgi:hypothetical protein